jgi:glycosyltransferase involved in cell wall biosynthesis
MIEIATKASTRANPRPAMAQKNSGLAGSNHPPIKIAFISSFPPRQCGLATFTNDVIKAVTGQFPSFEPVVIALGEPGLNGPGRKYPPLVNFRLDQNDRAAYTRAASFINQSGIELLCVQHEFGLYGGEAGEWLVELLRQVKVPVVTVLHTVLAEPEAAYRRVTLELVKLSKKLVVLTHTARRLMQAVYKVPSRQLAVIYHGVPDVPVMMTGVAKTRLGLEGRRVLSTFGLINKGKGIEYAIEALPPLVERYPDLLYLVLGQTHPQVRQQEGESYRHSLEERVAKLGLQNHVRFVNRYLDFDGLCQYLSATDIYLTPYLGRDQIVSGTLAYALGFGKAIVSTPYLYAEEALAEGRGLLVQWCDSQSISAALLELLSNPGRFRQIQKAAYDYGHQMAWPNIGRQYGNLFLELNGSKLVSGLKFSGRTQTIGGAA